MQEVDGTAEVSSGPEGEVGRRHAGDELGPRGAGKSGPDRSAGRDESSRLGGAEHPGGGIALGRAVRGDLLVKGTQVLGAVRGKVVIDCRGEDAVGKNPADLAHGEVHSSRNQAAVATVGDAGLAEERGMNVRHGLTHLVVQLRRETARLPGRTVDVGVSLPRVAL